MSKWKHCEDQQKSFYFLFISRASALETIPTICYKSVTLCCFARSQNNAPSLPWKSNGGKQFCLLVRNNLFCFNSQLNQSFTCKSFQHCTCKVKDHARWTCSQAATMNLWATWNNFCKHVMSVSKTLILASIETLQNVKISLHVKDRHMILSKGIN